MDCSKLAAAQRKQVESHGNEVVNIECVVPPDPREQSRRRVQSGTQGPQNRIPLPGRERSQTSINSSRGVDLTNHVFSFG